MLYEHSVRNEGLADAFDNHLKPEIADFEGMKPEFTDVRITQGADVALFTRQHKIEGKMRGRDITAAGNETLVWKKVGDDWKVAHIHYSHPCPGLRRNQNSLSVPLGDFKNAKNTGDLNSALSRHIITPVSYTLDQ